VVKDTVVFLTGRRVKGAPDVALVSWWLNLKVMKPEEDRSPCGWKRLRERCSEKGGV
jgi:hypothetical protein